MRRDEEMDKATHLELGDGKEAEEKGNDGAAHPDERSPGTELNLWTILDIGSEKGDQEG